MPSVHYASCTAGTLPRPAISRPKAGEAKAVRESGRRRVQSPVVSSDCLYHHVPRRGRRHRLIHALGDGPVFREADRSCRRGPQGAAQHLLRAVTQPGLSMGSFSGTGTVNQPTPVWPDRDTAQGAFAWRQLPTSTLALGLTRPGLAAQVPSGSPLRTLCQWPAKRYVLRYLPGRVPPARTSRTSRRDATGPWLPGSARTDLQGWLPLPDPWIAGARHIHWRSSARQEVSIRLCATITWAYPGIVCEKIGQAQSQVELSLCLVPSASH